MGSNPSSLLSFQLIAMSLEQIPCKSYNLLIFPYGLQSWRQNKIEHRKLYEPELQRKWWRHRRYLVEDSEGNRWKWNKKISLLVWKILEWRRRCWRRRRHRKRDKILARKFSSCLTGDSFLIHFLSLSLSLSLTHTHTHTLTRFLTICFSPLRLCNIRARLWEKIEWRVGIFTSL